MQMQGTNTFTVKVLPYSISSLGAYETCPRRFFLTKTKQASERQSDATLHGNEVHKSLELAVKGTQGLPYKHRMYQPVVDRVMRARGVKQAERNFALTQSFVPCDYWAPNAWVRGKIDFTLIQDKNAVALDWKTGKPKQDDNGQLALTAAAIFAERPAVQKVKTGYIWLAHDKTDSETYVREQVPEIWQGFLPRVSRMVHSAATNYFPPRPSGLCKEWCPVGQKLCEFCGS